MSALDAEFKAWLAACPWLEVRVDETEDETIARQAKSWKAWEGFKAGWNAAVTHHDVSE